MKRVTCLRWLVVLAALGWAVRGAPAAGIADKVKGRVQAFGLEQVQLLDGPCKAAMAANRRYLLSLEADELLYTFRKNAGLDTPGKPLEGWEKPDSEVRGHFTGHYLSACALLYANTRDEAVRARGTLLVAELAKCQQALGGEYLAAFPASYFDRWEATQAVWAPYYTIHKIMAGLYDQYALCGNAQALEMLKRMAAYFKQRTERFTAADMDRMMERNEEGGMAEVLWNLYSVTGDADHRALAEKFEERLFLNRLAAGEDCLAGRHGNTHIPLAIGAARRYELTGEDRYRYMATFFWDRVVSTRSFATGGSTNGEIWGPPYLLAGTLSNSNHETCKTYNMLRLTRELFQWTADAVYADFHERAFFNGILGTQEPESGMLEYYVPQATGYRRVYGTPRGAFWCCYGTGIETFAKICDSIYYHDERDVWVNLFIPSVLQWTERGLRIEQTTRFPEEPRTRFVVHVKEPRTFALMVHVPGWVAGGARVRVNGQPVDIAARPSSFARIEREWKDGDEATVEMPMELRTWPMPDDPNLVALTYGPIVLAGLIDGDEPGRPIHSGNPLEPQPGVEHIRRYYFLADSPRDVSWLRPVPGKTLTFRTEGQPFAMTFAPFYRVTGQRYGLYWPVIPAGSDRQAKIERQNREQEEWQARVVDEVRPGDEASEKAHNLKAEKSAVGNLMGRGWRHAEGGWWSWELKVLPDAPTMLACMYWGDDVPPRTFDILVDGRKIATQSLDHNRPGEFFRVEYALPAELLRGKGKVTVQFRAHAGNTAGGVFGCATLREPRGPQSGQADAQTRPINSFESPGELAAVTGNHAQLQPTVSYVTAGKQAVEARFQPADWPNVSMVAPTPWDWRGFDGLAVDITNPGKEPLDFAVRVDDDPRADGVVHCRQGGGRLEPGTTASFVLYLGADPMTFGMRGLPNSPRPARARPAPRYPCRSRPYRRLPGLHALPL